MNKTIKAALVSLLALGSVAACSAGEAADMAPASSSSPQSTDPHSASPDGHQTKAGAVTRLMTQSLPDIAGKEGMIEIVDFAPGEASQVHRHNCDLFVYVLEGSVVTQVKGGKLQTVPTGGVFYESPTDVHVVSRNASATEPAKLAVFYVKAKGTPPTVILNGDN
ncbi:cupin domain-containing protein [Amycolatopsis sp. DSM 110486]|uniref:cupin domain-containing protein n=1 Tax=Amycolatopsis sp. DSM 110486 TaxID=2865832 RepID=UPI001C69507E|nr:cupin domain-containing protein [Amycolatopsis sp. DSM 110486]QYN21731.1 cupin domain-containing protein [Amycolatopsis sp. DSM 110486]